MWSHIQDLSAVIWCPQNQKRLSFGWICFACVGQVDKKFKNDPMRENLQLNTTAFFKLY